jgi:indolepyruvate ferredoxin oxidoreductase beta subunit
MAHGWTRILVVGVGGQGVLSAGRWLGDAAHGCGLDVVVRQIHGMSQRGGSVRTSVTIGGARSAEIPTGLADAVVALEPMEAARAVDMLSERTLALVNTRPLLPVSLQSAGRPYPPLESLLGPIEETARELISLDATALAETAGSPRCLNVVMLGMLAGSGVLSFPGQSLLEVIVCEGIAAFEDVNRRAFEAGAEAVAGSGGE